MAEIATSMKIAFALMGVAFLFFVLGFCAPYWHLHEWVDMGRTQKVYYGLWKWCVEEQKYRQLPYDFCFSTISEQYGRDYIRATQFFETVGLLSAIVSFVLLLLGVCIATCRDRRILPILSAICAIGA
ncbi:hypothetical protein BaRGS_00021452, partial [Batillaria attramentaria]